MAALKNHGYEVARLTKSMQVPRDDDTVTDYRVVLSFRSDGHILRNLTALNIHDTTYGGSPHHTYGWKLYKKLSDRKPLMGIPARMKGIARQWRDQSAASGRLIDFKENV